jgi:hypothetical protein
VKSLSRVDSIPSTRIIRILQGDSSSTITRTPTSIRRHSTSASRPQRRNQSRETPHFSLDGARRKGLKELDIAAANAPLNGGPSTRRKAYNSAVAEYAAVLPTSSNRSSRISSDMARRRSNQRSSFEGLLDFPLPVRALPPVPPVPPVGITSVENERSRQYRAASFSRHDGSPTSSVVYGSDIVQTNRVYDPTRDIPDTIRHRRSAASSHSSPNNAQERVSMTWPRRDDTLSTVQEDTKSIRHSGDLYGIAKKTRGTFGAKSTRASKTKRRSSVDAGVIVPYIFDGIGPPSPSSAPVSRQAIIPVLGPGERRAVATGISNSASNPMSSSRIRFGARPMRPAKDFGSGSLEHKGMRGSLDNIQ